MSIDLSALLPVPRTINLGRGDVEIRGLNITHVGRLLEENSDELMKFLAGGEPDIAALVTVLPHVAVKLIAMGLDCEGQEEVIKKIPLATQIDILIDIWELSVPDAKKLKARLGGLSDALKNLAAKADQGSPDPSQRVLPLGSSS